MSEELYIVEYMRHGIWKGTNWTNPLNIADFPNKPFPVPLKEAEMKLETAKAMYPDTSYRLKKVTEP